LVAARLPQRRRVPQEISHYSGARGGKGFSPKLPHPPEDDY